MAYEYNHFIPQNIAPKGAKSIGVYKDGEKVYTIPLNGLSPVSKTKLYSFGLVSDLHLWKTTPAWNANAKFDNALTCFETEGCAFCVACGDLTQTGFYLRADEGTAGTEYVDEEQFARYKEICDKHTIQIYEFMGNHESYYAMPITNNLDKMATYTGNSALSYTVEQGNDLFIFVGQPDMLVVMSEDDFSWLGTILESNKDKRCFVFIHSNIDDNVEGGIEDSGNPAFARENSIFGYWGATKTANFLNLMKQYQNAILFHGHTHIMFGAQTFDKTANYTDKNGFKSVHIPSLGLPRELLSTDGTWEGRDAESQGYIVDVYDDCIVLNGMDFINNEYVPLGVLKIDV